MFQLIIVRHPAYYPPNTLLTLPASDGDQRDRAHYATVLAACAILVRRGTNIWLSSFSSGEPRAEPDDGFIIAGQYYLHVEHADNTNPFPIYPNFRSWPFPHGFLPALFRQAADTDARIEAMPAAPEACRITNKRLACEGAHIIPASEKAWFVSNEMERYGSSFARTGQAVAESSENLMQLRRDAHWLWDTLQFSIVAREDANNDREVTWFSCMNNVGDELFADWHYKRLQSLHGRAPEFIFARFAWTIFPKLHTFLQAQVSRRLIVRNTEGQETVCMHSPAECWEFTTGQGKGRSASSLSKRRKNAETPPPTEYQLQHGTQEFEVDIEPSQKRSPDSAIAVLHARVSSGSRDYKEDPDWDAERSARAKASSNERWLAYLTYRDQDEETRGRKRQRS